MTDDTLLTLMAARMLISDEESWTQNAPARNKFGRDVVSFSEQACSWCADGAVRAVLHEASFSELRKHASVLRELDITINGPLHTRGIWASWSVVTKFNDSHIHAEVLDAFDATIERLS